MKKPRTPRAIGRKHRAAGWTLLVLGMLVAGVWVWSGFSLFDIVTRHPSRELEWGIRQGRVRIVYTTDNVRSMDEIKQRLAGSKETVVIDPDTFSDSYQALNGSRAIWSVAWTPFSRFAGGSFFQRTTTTKIALWPFPLLLGTPAALCFCSGIFAQRRAMKGACPKCGYSLAGLTKDRPFPECGKAAASTT